MEKTNEEQVADDLLWANDATTGYFTYRLDENDDMIADQYNEEGDVIASYIVAIRLIQTDTFAGRGY